MDNSKIMDRLIHELNPIDDSKKNAFFLMAEK